MAGGIVEFVGVINSVRVCQRKVTVQESLSIPGDAAALCAVPM